MSKEKPVYQADGVTFDSEEELFFYYWCVEAKEHGYLSKFNYHPDSFVLTERASVFEKVQKVLKKGTKTVIVEHFLMHPHVYTADFVLDFTPLMERFRHGLFTVIPNTHHVDIKGSSFKAGKNFNSGREFSINQKLVWKMTGNTVYVNKLVPEEFFKATWVPEKARYTPKKHDLAKKYKDMRTVSVCEELPLLPALFEICKGSGEEEPAKPVICNPPELSLF